MRIVRLNSDDRFQQILREGRENSRAPILNRASVTDGQTSFNGNESLIVTGSQKVTGWLIVTGTLKVVGAFLLDGITTITGALTATGVALFTGAFTSRGTTRFEGDTSQIGPFHVVGATDLRGALELFADLVVKAGGKMTIEGVDPMLVGLTAAGRPGIQFSTGSQLVGTSSGIQMNNSTGNGFVYANAAAGMSRGGSKVELTTTGVEIAGDITSNLPQIAASGKTPNVWCDPVTKKLYRLT